MLLDTFLLILIKVGQRHTVLAVGAGGGGLDISFLFSFSLCLGDGKIKTDDTVSKGRKNPKQPISQLEGENSIDMTRKLCNSYLLSKTYSSNFGNTEAVKRQKSMNISRAEYEKGWSINVSVKIVL